MRRRLAGSDLVMPGNDESALAGALSEHTNSLEAKDSASDLGRKSEDVAALKVELTKARWTAYEEAELREKLQAENAALREQLKSAYATTREAIPATADHDLDDDPVGIIERASNAADQAVAALPVYGGDWIEQLAKNLIDEQWKHDEPISDEQAIEILDTVLRAQLRVELFMRFRDLLLSVWGYASFWALMSEAEYKAKKDLIIHRKFMRERELRNNAITIAEQLQTRVNELEARLLECTHEATHA
jgi:hypothetical protein